MFWMTTLPSNKLGLVNPRPNPFAAEIKGLMNTRDMYHKRGRKSSDKLRWSAYQLFRQEVKREIRLAETFKNMFALKSLIRMAIPIRFELLIVASQGRMLD